MFYFKRYYIQSMQDFTNSLILDNMELSLFLFIIVRSDIEQNSHFRKEIIVSR